MGLFEKIFGPRPQQVTGAYFKTLNGYAPVFTSRSGSIYEMEQTRSAIHAFATHASKLKPEQQGSAKPALGAVLQSQPNPWMNTAKFLYKTATILEVDTCVFLVPMVDGLGAPTGQVYPVMPAMTAIYEVDGDEWMVYSFGNGRKAAIEFWRVGVMTKYGYKSDFFGDGNAPLNPTLDLLDVQRQGMTEGVKNSATIRFIGRLMGTLRPEDITAERDRFSEENLSADNTSGVMLVDAKYADIKQIEGKPYVIDAEQMKLIKDNVHSYFGTNDAILQNDFDEQQWNAFYEGKIEPFALDLSLTLTNMFFTARERAFGNGIILSANRLQYASNETKLQVTRELTDRGLISMNQALDIWNLPHVEGGDRRIIRGEYIDVENLPTHTVGDARSYLLPATQPSTGGAE